MAKVCEDDVEAIRGKGRGGLVCWRHWMMDWQTGFCGMRDVGCDEMNPTHSFYCSLDGGGVLEDLGTQASKGVLSG